MFKKTLAAAALVGCFAGSAFAADVTLYGVVDYGMTYQNKSVDGADDADKFTMESGQKMGNRWGLKGTEELGNGVNVGFQLESGFTADDAQLDNEGRLFGREARVFVNGDFGEIAFGRMGQLASGNGSYGIFTGNVSPFGTGWGNAAAGHTAVFAGGYARMDNMVTYKTPTFAGLTAFAQYSFDNNTKDKTITENTAQVHGQEGDSDVNRYYGLGLQYKAGDAEAVVIVDSINYASGHDAIKKYEDDSLTVSAGAAYNFGILKAYVAGNYANNVTQWGKIAKFTEGGDFALTKGGYAAQLEGYGVNLGVDVPLFGGTAKLSGGYGEAEQNNVAAGEDKPEMKVYAVTLGYTYNLSKRTAIYTAADYISADYSNFGGANADQKDQDICGFTIGMTHSF